MIVMDSTNELAMNLGKTYLVTESRNEWYESGWTYLHTQNPVFNILIAERMIDKSLSGEDGSLFFESLKNNLIK